MSRRIITSIVLVAVLLCTAFIPAYSSLMTIMANDEDALIEQTVEPQNDNAEVFSLNNTRSTSSYDLGQYKSEQYSTDMSAAYAGRNTPEEYVDTQSGNLTVSQVDYIIPMVNNRFELKRIFNSAGASQDVEVDSNNQLTTKDSFYKDAYKLGDGWRFSFPMLELIKTNNTVESIIYHSESGAVYTITPNENESSNLEDTEFTISNHKLNDMKVKFYSEDSKNLDFVKITHIREGVIYTFDTDGKIIYISYSDETLAHSEDEEDAQVKFDYNEDDGKKTTVSKITVKTGITGDSVVESTLAFSYGNNNGGMLSHIKTTLGEYIKYEYKGTQLETVHDIDEELKNKYFYSDEVKNLNKYVPKNDGSSELKPVTTYVLEGILYCKDNRLSKYEYTVYTPNINNKSERIKVSKHQDYTVVGNAESADAELFDYNVKLLGSETQYHCADDKGVAEKTADGEFIWTSADNPSDYFLNTAEGVKRLKFQKADNDALNEIRVYVKPTADEFSVKVNGVLCELESESGETESSTDVAEETTDEVNVEEDSLVYIKSDTFSIDNDGYSSISISYSGVEVEKITVSNVIKYITSEKLEIYNERFGYMSSFWKQNTHTDTSGGFEFESSYMYSWRRMHSEMISVDDTYEDFILDTTISFMQYPITKHTSAGVVFWVNNLNPGNNNFDGYYVRISPETDNNENQSTIGLFKMRSNNSNPYNNETATQLVVKKFADANLGEKCDSSKAYALRVKAVGPIVEVYVVDMDTPVIVHDCSNDNGSYGKGSVGVRTFQRRAAYLSFSVTSGEYQKVATKTEIADNPEKTGEKITTVTSDIYNFENNLTMQQIVAEDYKTIKAYEYDENRMPRQITTYEYEKIGDKFELKYTSSESYIYDEYGNLIEYRSPLAHKVDDAESAESGDLNEGELRPYVTKYEYDNTWGLLTQKTMLKDDETKLTYIYDLTPNSNMIQKESIFVNEEETPIKVTEYGYNDYCRLISKKVTEKGESTYTSYEYEMVSDDEKVTLSSVPYAITETLYENAPEEDTTTEDATDVEAVSEGDEDIVGISSKTTIDALTGNVEIVTDYNGNKTIYEYDTLQRLKKTTYPGGDSVNYAYGDSYFSETGSYRNDIVTRTTTFTDENGNVVVTEYDSYGRAVKRTSGDAIIENKYDERGNLIWARDGKGNVTECTYDALNRMVSKTLKTVESQNSGTDLDEYTYIEEYTYGYITYGTESYHSVRTTYGDGEGSNTVVFDALNREVSNKSGDYIENKFEYDYLGNKTAVVDGRKNTTVFEYDSLGRVVKTINANDDVIELTYNKFNNVSTKKDTRTLTEYTYDSFGRVIEERYYSLDDAGEKIETDDYYVEYTYDNNGNVLTLSKGKYVNGAKSESEKTAFTYDERNNVLTQENKIDAANVIKTTYEYDNCGNAEKKIMTRGSDTIEAISAYDHENRLLSEICKLNGNIFSVVEYEYDNCGNMITKKMHKSYNAEDEQHTDYVTEKYTYDVKNQVITQTATNGETIKYDYDARGNVTKQGYWNNNILTAPVENIYDTAGLLKETKTRNVESDGTITYNATKYEYDAAGNMVKEISPLSTDTDEKYIAYTYDNLNRRTETIIHENGEDVVAQTVQYDVRNNVVKETSGNVVTCYTYDAANNITEVKTGNSSVKSMYDGSGRTVSITDGNNTTTVFEYFLDGNVRSITYADGTSITYNVSDYGFTTSVEKDRAGNKTITTLNGVGLPTSVKYPDNTTQNYTYDLLGKVLTQTNQEGTATQYEYDDRGNVKVVTITAQGETTPARTVTYSYYDNNLLKDETVGCGEDTYVVSHVYDEYKREIETTDTTGAKTTIEYNPAGKVKAKNVYYITSEDDTKSKFDTISYEYDVRLNVVKETVGQYSRTYAYNEAGLCSKIIDFDGSEVSYSYDNGGNLSEVRSAAKNERCTYDGNGNVKTVLQLEGDSWDTYMSYEYDIFNNVVESKDALQNVTTYEYDANNNLIKTILPEQQISGKGTNYTYDVMNRPTKIILPNGVVKVEYVYDCMGRVIKEYRGEKSEDTTFNAYEYDIFGNVEKMTNYAGKETTYVYDERGNMISSTDPLNNTTEYSYTLNGLVESVLYPDGGETTYSYDKKGRVIESKVKQSGTGDDIIWSKTTYAYNEIDKPVTITSPDGGEVTYTYDGCGNILAHKDAVGNTNTYTYNGGLLASSCEYGVTTNYTYDSQGRIKTKATGSRVAVYTYDEVGRLKTVVSSDRGMTSYKYDGNGNKIEESILRAAGEYDTTTYTYDDNNQVISVTYNTEPVSSVCYVYDDFSRLIEENNNGRITTYTYDVMDRVVSTTMPDGGTIKNWYDDNGNIIASRDAIGNFDCYSYDKMNRIKSTADGITSEFIAGLTENDIVAFMSSSGYVSAPKAMQYVYDYAGNVLSETNVNGKSNTYTYDLCNRVLTVTTPDGTVASTKEYDGNGNVVSDMDAKGLELKGKDGAGYSEVYKYENNRLVSVTDREGNEVTYTYNEYGETASVTDALGNETTYEYDNGGRLSKVDSGLGVTVEYTYDAAGNALTQTDGEGHVTEYTYYPFGIMKSLTDADGNVDVYEYDEFGNVVSKTDGNGQVVKYSYNTHNLLTRISADDIIIVYEYDLNGNRILMDDESGEYTYTYDARDRLLTVTKDDADYLSYEYDIVGNLSKMYTGVSLHSSYTYDANNRVTKVNDITYTYDKNGNLASITTDAGTTAYEYNKNNAVTKVTNTLADETVISMYSYTYYDNGNQATKTDKNNVVTTYVYDGAGRLATVSTPDLIREYTYDNAGNRESMSETYPKLSEGATRTEAFGDETVEYDIKTVYYLYSKANVLTTATEVCTNSGVETGKKITRHTFDKAGNEISTSVEYVLPYVEADEEPSEEASEEATGELGLTSVAENDSYGAKDYDLAIEVTINEYNALNQLVGMSSIKNGKRSSAEYIYDGDGLRISKTINDDIWKNIRSVGSTWTYVYSGKTVVGMTDGTSEIAAMYIGAFGCQQIDYIWDSSEYNFTNAHGDVTNSVKADGTILNTFDYDEFGNLTVCEENQVSYLQMAHFRYAGEYYDIETGNYYLKARYYNPSTGRFTQVDSFLGYSDNVLSLNRYTYCHNNPIMFVDPSGHAIKTTVEHGIELAYDDSNNLEEFYKLLDAFHYNEIYLETFIRMANQAGVPVWVNDANYDDVYRMSGSSNNGEVYTAETLLTNSSLWNDANKANSWSSGFVSYYVDKALNKDTAEGEVRRTNLGTGNENMYQLIYDSPQDENRHGESNIVNMYAGYEYSIFDALNWMIQTSGNINFVLQTRVTRDVTKATNVQYEIIKDFIVAHELLNGNGYETKLPEIFVGSTEFDGVTALEIYDNIVANLSEYKEGRYAQSISGVYFGNETTDDPTVTSEEGDSARKVSKTMREKGKKVIWIPYITNTIASTTHFENMIDGTVLIEKIENPDGTIDVVNKEVGIFDVVIVQPNVYYADEYDIGAFYDKMNLVNGYIGTRTNGTKVGVEFEVDMGIFTGRVNYHENHDENGVLIDQYYQGSLTAKEKTQIFNMYLDYFQGYIVKGNVPIGIYSGGPNEQGYRNVHYNGNALNVGNHLPYVDTNERVELSEVIGYNGRTYDEFSDYSGNVIHDIEEFLINGVKSEKLKDFLSY